MPVLHLTVKPNAVDVNVHPTKTEVKFQSEQQVFSTVYHAVLSALTRDRTRPQAVLQAPKVQDTVTPNQTSLTFQDVTAAPQAVQPQTGWKAAPTYRPAPRQSAQAARPAQAAQTPQRPAPRTKPDIPPQASAGSPFRRVTPLPSAKEEKPFAQAATPVPVPEAATQPVPAAPASETSSQQALKAPAPTPEVASQEQPWLIRGELFRTYIMVEQGDKVVLIDKHAAHERANFDRLKAADYQPMVQELLSPVTFIPAPEDRTALLEQLPLLARFGFEVEEFGGSALAVRACPDYLDAGDIEDALLELARRKGLDRVYIHAFLDGRDVSPTSGKGFVADCAETCRRLGVGKISTVMGRYYAMDRDNRWERVQLAYDAMVYGEGNQNPDPVDAVAQSYVAGVTDEFMEPVVCDSDGTVSDNDSVIFFNFRPDRAREITRAIVDPDFTGFQREFFPTTYVCNTEYDASMPNVLVAWPRVAVKNGLGEYLSSLSLTQLRIAETEKYAHVTFFFNGGVEKQYPGEDRVLVPSPKVATYDLQPEMSAYEVCDKCVERINSGAYDVVILNFANCDMVGHTGVLEAAVKAVETVDTCVGRVVEATLKMGGIAMITADHGNAEVMRQPDGSPMTAHTTNPVPFILCGAGTELRTGRLADIAPTILDVMGLACPPEMDGKSLIVR